MAENSTLLPVTYEKINKLSSPAFSPRLFILLLTLFPAGFLTLIIAEGADRPSPQISKTTTSGQRHKIGRNEISNFHEGHF